MAKKQEDKPAVAGQGDKPTGSRRFVRYCLVGLLLGAVLLCWLSLLTFDPADWPSKAVYPHGPIKNAAGRVGAYLAFTLRYWVGGGAYMGLLFATVSGVVMVLGGRVRELPWRIVGLILLIMTTSAAVFLADPVDPAGASDVLNGSAGILGIAAGDFLAEKFGRVGAWLVALIALGIGLMLAADNFVMQLPRLGKKVLKRTREWPLAIGSLRPGAASAVTAGPRPITTARSAPATAPAPARPVARPASPAPQTSVARPTPPAPAPPKPAGRKAERKPDQPRNAQYVLPSADLLAEPSDGYSEVQEAAAGEKSQILQETLNNFNVAAEVVGYMTGPVITMFELSLSPGVKVSHVSNLAKDIARALAVPGVRIVSPIPGKDTIGIEVPNLEKEIVRIKELMNMAPDAEARMHLPLYLGKDAAGNAIVADLASMPHMLIAGTTGSGKSVCINAIIVAMLLTRTPEDVRLILVDPKMVEMAAFEKIPHLLCPIVNDMRRAEEILEWAATKMDERYELFKEAGVKNIAQYNRLGADEVYRRLHAETDEERSRVPTKVPYYVIIIDELADLIMTSSKEVEGHIIRIAQKARAVGIHLILATQRPSVNVVTGLIKSNMPCRISFRVASRQESRIVLDQNGADVLLGQGDMLFLQPGTSNLIRAQGTYLSETEIRSVMDKLQEVGEPQFNGELMRMHSRPIGESGSAERDELFNKAVEIVLQTQRGSVSLLQRRMQIGYSRASRIIDQMADAGILGEYKGSQARECNMTLDDWQALQASIAADQSGESSADGEPTIA